MCVINFVLHKMRLLDVLARLLENISNMLKKDFIYLGLEKKKSKKVQASLNIYIKTVSFIIYLY